MRGERREAILILMVAAFTSFKPRVLLGRLYIENESLHFVQLLCFHFNTGKQAFRIALKTQKPADAGFHFISSY
jgi:hypothetical protein